MTRATIEADPTPLSVDFDKTALVIIDMQRDFLEPGTHLAAHQIQKRSYDTNMAERNPGRYCRQDSATCRVVRW